MKRLLKRPHPSVPGPRPQSPVESQRAAARLAFTLLELLIAISIIAILASLILAVAGSASRKAHDAQVSADILNLATGIAAFKQRFGVEPPSSIYLYEQASGWTNASDPNAARSMGLIRQIWPQFDFTYGAYASQSNAVDINGNGTTNDVISLTGAECLVFFLGGIPGGSGGPPMGFSQSPADPFNVPGVGAARQVVGTNRERFTEFDVSRLFLYSPANSVVSGVMYHSMNTYKDPLTSQTQPYLYLSSYGGQGYYPYELVGLPPATPSLGSAPGQNSPTGNAFIDVYRQGSVGYWSSTSPSFVQNTATPSPAWNPNSYQIISPGGDTQYGTGGEYETANSNTLLIGTRGGERDNITNITGGVLAP
jgi:prepilin-type N-terminal cleavage/methylation domain-containing protein